VLNEREEVDRFGCKGLRGGSVDPSPVDLVIPVIPVTMIAKIRGAITILMRLRKRWAVVSKMATADFAASADSAACRTRPVATPVTSPMTTMMVSLS
jgi:hypothetical protein